MVLAHWDISVDQRKIAQQLGTIPRAGTPGSRLKQLNIHSIKVYYSQGNINDLRNAIAQNIPPIVLLNTKDLSYVNETYNHSVVLSNIDNNVVTLHDPTQTHPQIQIPQLEFELAWDEMLNLYALLTVA